MYLCVWRGEGIRAVVCVASLPCRPANTNSVPSLQAALCEALASRAPTLINAVLDPMAGVESGSAHSFNAPKPAAAAP